MNDTYHDAVIRAALTPGEDVRPPVGLAHEIHRQLLATPQQPRTFGGRVAGLRWMPTLSPMAVLFLLLLALAGIAAGAALLLMGERAAPLGVHSYHGGPGLTGVMVGPGPVTEPVVEWEVRLPRPLTNSTMPLVSDGTVYVVDVRGDALALDLATGAQRWSVALPADVSGTPLIAKGLLVVPADDGIVRALDLGTGSIAWSADLGARAGSSVAGWGELALVGADDGRVHSLDVTSGVEQWSVDAGGPVVNTPAIEHGMAYVVTHDGPITAFDAVTGEIRWTKGDLGPGYTTPSIHDGVLHVAHGFEGGDQPFELIALDVRVGDGSGPRELWRWQGSTPDLVFLGAVTPDAVYAVSADHNVYVLDQETGHGELLLETGAAIGSHATVAGDILYVASQDERVYAIDRSARELLWSAEVDGWPASPVAADGRLIVGTEFGQLVSLVEPAQPAP